MNLSCIIVDDEPLAIRLLENFIERTPFLTLKASFTDSVAAMQSITNDSADVLFLDIQMPDMNGMELSHMVPSHTRIIFSRSLKTIFQHKACTVKLYADSFYKVQKNSHSSFEVICCCS